MRAPLTLAEALAVTAGRGRRAGFLLDFDGTVAPIELDPDAVWPVPGAVEALGRLAARAGAVGIVSARPVSFLRARLGAVDGVTLHGLYGLESLRPDGETATLGAAEAWRGAVRDVAVRAPRELPAGARVEDKGLSVALHYREHPEVRPAIEEWSRTEAAKLGLRAQEGRMAVELRPPVDRDKGSVVTDEVGDLSCAWYFGDDLSDLHAFEALAALEAAGEGFVGIRAAVRNPETGGRLADLADVLLDGPESVPPLLEHIAETL